MLLGIARVWHVLLLATCAEQVLLDWSEWDSAPPVPPGRTSEEAPVFEGRDNGDLADGRRVEVPTDFPEEVACQERWRLRRLVYECSRQLELPGFGCAVGGEGGEGGDGVDDDYRVPFFFSQKACGFEVSFYVPR